MFILSLLNVIKSTALINFHVLTPENREFYTIGLTVHKLFADNFEASILLPSKEVILMNRISDLSEFKGYEKKILDVEHCKDHLFDLYIGDISFQEVESNNTISVVMNFCGRELTQDLSLEIKDSYVSLTMVDSEIIGRILRTIELKSKILIPKVTTYTKIANSPLNEKNGSINFTSIADELTTHRKALKSYCEKIHKIRCKLSDPSLQLIAGDRNLVTDINHGIFDEICIIENMLNHTERFLNDIKNVYQSNNLFRLINTPIGLYEKVDEIKSPEDVKFADSKLSNAVEQLNSSFQNEFNEIEKSEFEKKADIKEVRVLDQNSSADSKKSSDQIVVDAVNKKVRFTEPTDISSSSSTLDEIKEFGNQITSEAENVLRKRTSDPKNFNNGDIEQPNFENLHDSVSQDKLPMDPELRKQSEEEQAESIGVSKALGNYFVFAIFIMVVAPYVWSFVSKLY